MTNSVRVYSQDSKLDPIPFLIISDIELSLTTYINKVYLIDGICPI